MRRELVNVRLCCVWRTAASARSADLPGARPPRLFRPSRPGEFHPEPLSRVESRRGPGFDDADVSSTLPIIPYGGFSPIRLEGWHVGQHLPTHPPGLTRSLHT